MSASISNFNYSENTLTGAFFVNLDDIAMDTSATTDESGEKKIELLEGTYRKRVDYVYISYLYRCRVISGCFTALYIS